MSSFEGTQNRERFLAVMRKLPRFVFAFLFACVSSIDLRADVIYSGPTETSHFVDPAFVSNDPRFLEWANLIDSAQTAFAPRGSTVINQSGGFNSLGDLNTTEIASGSQPGVLTVRFPSGIRNGAGHDFAVFENGFVFPSEPNLFAELAFVEVSSDGTNYARFPSISTNLTWAGTFGQSFGGFDTTKIFNLAGKHAGGFGTPFNLDDLASNGLVGSGLLDLNNIQYLKLVDIPGNGAYLDSLGNPILDTWLGSGTSGGFDFRLGTGVGVGVLNSIASVPEPSSIVLLWVSTIFIAKQGRRRKVSVEC